MATSPALLSLTPAVSRHPHLLFSPSPSRCHLRLAPLAASSSPSSGLAGGGGGVFLSPHALSQLDALAEFRYEHAFPHDRLTVRALTPADDAMTEALVRLLAQFRAILHERILLSLYILLKNFVKQRSFVCRLPPSELRRASPSSVRRNALAAPPSLRIAPPLPESTRPACVRVRAAPPPLRIAPPLPSPPRIGPAHADPAQRAALVATRRRMIEAIEDRGEDPLQPWRGVSNFQPAPAFTRHAPLCVHSFGDDLATPVSSAQHHDPARCALLPQDQRHRDVEPVHVPAASFAAWVGGGGDGSASATLERALSEYGGGAGGTLPEFIGAGGGEGIFRVPLRAAMHPERPPALEVRPHPLRETQLHQVGSRIVPGRWGVLGVGGDVRAVRVGLLARRALQGRPPLPQSVDGIRWELH